MNADKKKQFVYELLIEYVRQNNLMKDNALDKDVDRLWVHDTFEKLNRTYKIFLQASNHYFN